MKIIETDPYAPDAQQLIDELSKHLESITGSSGRNSFDLRDVCAPRSMFIIAYNENNEAVGCGGIRPVNENTAEVKRMYAKMKSAGVGTKILCYLEKQAHKMGYHTLLVETRLINKQAVSFYRKNGYHCIPNYGKYANNPEAVCFEKFIG